MTDIKNMPNISIGDLEEVYDLLAKAIDQAGPEADKVFLVKLALLCARDNGDAKRFAALIEQALHNLP